MRMLLVFLMSAVFSLQALPVKKVTRLISKCQSTEQSQSSDCDDDDANDDDTIGSALCNLDIILPGIFDQERASVAFVEKKSIIVRSWVARLNAAQIVPIPSPPPDFNC
jgi:hypothetical protein